MNTQKKNGTIIVAAGKGQRLGAEIPKQFLMFGQKEILAHTVAKWEAHENTDEIVLVVGKEDILLVEEMSVKYGWQKIVAIVAGGDWRGDSVRRGLSAFSKNVEIISVHDGVRPFVTKEMMDLAIEKAREMGAAVVGVPVKDTIKQCSGEDLVLSTPKRNELWQIQTPQTFRRDWILDAYQKAEESDFVGTDDGAVVEFAGYPVHVVMGSYRNIKITTEEDLLLAKYFLREEKL